jgi:prepilin-type N-terminal cleavage/methylation domain-containing protein
MNKTSLQQKGFTLVETLVAISILVIVITAAYSAAQTGISSSTLSKEQIVAFYLAQEQIEAIRNIRDENSINGIYWLAGIDDPVNQCQTGNGCYVDVACWFWRNHGGCQYGSTVINACPSGSGNSNNCPVLSQNTLTKDYRYIPAGTSGWAQTTYRPKVEIQNTGGAAQALSVLVTVTWTKGNITRDFKIRENIFDWQ